MIIPGYIRFWMVGNTNDWIKSSFRGKRGIGPNVEQFGECRFKMATLSISAGLTSGSGLRCKRGSTCVHLSNGQKCIWSMAKVAQSGELWLLWKSAQPKRGNVGA